MIQSSDADPLQMPWQPVLHDTVGVNTSMPEYNKMSWLYVGRHGDRLLLANGKKQIAVRPEAVHPLIIIDGPSPLHFAGTVTIGAEHVSGLVAMPPPCSALVPVGQWSCQSSHAQAIVPMSHVTHADPQVMKSVEITNAFLLSEVKQKGIWYNLPDAGGNQIMRRAAVRNTPADPYDVFQELLFFPDLRDEGDTLVFRSGEFAHFGEITLEFGDLLVKCPQQHWWPWCALCEKFLFPPHAHRLSQCHQKKKRQALQHGLAAMANHYAPRLRLVHRCRGI